MRAGMIIRSKRRFKDTDRRWFIKKEGKINRGSTVMGLTMVKGYRIAPLENLEHGFWVTEQQIHERFEEDV